MQSIKLSILMLIIFSGVVNAVWLDKQGNTVPDSEHMKSVGDLVAQQIVTDNEAEAMKNWGTPSETVHFTTANEIERNKIITTFVVFGGCAVDCDRNCDLKMQITIYQPDGAIYGSLPIMEVWSGKPRPPNNNLGLSVDYMRIIIEPGEQLGKYKIDTKIIDKVSGHHMFLTSYFTAVEAK